MVSFADIGLADRKRGVAKGMGSLIHKSAKLLILLLFTASLPQPEVIMVINDVKNVSCVAPPPVLKSSSSILTWLKRRDGPSADIISNFTHLETFMDEDELVVLGLFKVTSLRNYFFLKEISLLGYLFSIIKCYIL